MAAALDVISTGANSASTWSTVNDLHSKLNLSAMERTLAPTTSCEVAEMVREASREGRGLAIAGGRHSMGGQQFATGGWLMDMRGLDRILDFDKETGTIKVEAGIQWPKLMLEYVVAQHGDLHPWGIAQKQTGADRLTIGGAVASNIHGRGLCMKPFVQDIVSLEIVDATGELVSLSREDDPALFNLVVGGYGLFGVVVSVTLKLVPRTKVERVVTMSTVDQLERAFADRIVNGYAYGDFQFPINPRSPDFLKSGVFSCYREVPADTPIPPSQRRLSQAHWEQLIVLAHRDKQAAFGAFVEFYLDTSGQIYWSDTQQLNIYLEDYHPRVDHLLDHASHGTEIITELYVPRSRLAAFMDRARECLRADEADVIYGTVRLIEKDDETFLAWARESFACVIFNLHTSHTPMGIANARLQFRQLIDAAIEQGGSYFLTYHRFASKEQVMASHPRLPDFLDAKRAYDPRGVFQSNWYRHYRTMFA